LVQRGPVTLYDNMTIGKRAFIADHLASGRVTLVEADALDLDALKLAMAGHDIVFHLAGVSFPPDAEVAPAITYDINTVGAVRLLSAIRRKRTDGSLDPTVIVVGSAMQYGAHDVSEMPLDEATEQRPATTYAASKAAQEVAALQLARASGMRVICTRSFNHSGAGHAAHYLVPSLVQRARAIARGEERQLVLGNDVIRDYLHVSDVVSAYLLLAERGVPGEVYNVASGRGVTARQLAERALLDVGVTAEISTEPTLVRASDIPILVGSPDKLTRDTGWVPVKTHTDIIADLLNASTD